MKKAIYFLFVFPLLMNAQAVCHEDSNTGESSGVADVSPVVNGSSTVQAITYTSSSKNVIGSPFAFKDWSKGEIITTDNLAVKYDKIQFDLERNQVIVHEKGSQVPTVISTDNIVSLSAKDIKGVRYFATIKSFEFNESQVDKLYEVFSTTNNYLIKETIKSLKVSNDDAEKMYYKKRTTYYIKDNTGKYLETKLSKKHLTKIMKDQEKGVAQYVKENKLSYKEKDVAKILEYYHSLVVIAKQ